MEQLYGLAVSLDGIDDWIDIPDHAFAGDFTIEAWVLLDPGIDNQDGLVGQEGSGQDINFYGGRARLFAPGDVLVANTQTPANTWTHIAITRSGSALTLYLNGAADATGTWTGVFSPKAIGRGNAGFLQGKMDEIRLWNVARSSGEIAASYDTDVPVGSSGLVGYWSLNGLGQSVTDLTGFNSGTLGGDLAPGSDDPTRIDTTAPLVENCGGTGGPPKPSADGTR